MSILSHNFDDALQFASFLHRQQKRKQTDIPYLGHLLSVAGLVMENGGDEIQSIAALLHDAIEDQSHQYPKGAAQLGEHIEARFGAEVRAIVEACTDSIDGERDGNWRARKEKYLAHIGAMDRRAALVSLADKVHNARSIVADLTRFGPALFERFTGKRDGTLWYYESLARAFREHHGQYAVLAAELQRLAAEMRAFAAV